MIANSYSTTLIKHHSDGMSQEKKKVKVQFHLDVNSLQAIEKFIIKLIILAKSLPLFWAQCFSFVFSFKIFFYNAFLGIRFVICCNLRCYCLAKTKHISKSKLTYSITIWYLTLSFAKLTPCIKFISYTAWGWISLSRRLLLLFFKVCESSFC